MSQKQTNSRIERQRANTSERARIEDIFAVGEVLDEESLRMVAGGASATNYAARGYDLKEMQTK